MSVVEKNKVVSVIYYITDESNEVVERIDIPVSFLFGENSGLFAKVENALEGVSIGERKEVVLEPSEGFGEWNPEYSFTDSIENVPPEYRQIGAEAEFRNENGEIMKFKVSHVDNGTVTLDGNHPFAGKTVRFSIEVKDIREPTAEELINGVSRTPGTLH
jgi:FKBP-type peptidyl-prolyl cis-trans isomerase SlyD